MRGVGTASTSNAEWCLPVSVRPLQISMEATGKALICLLTPLWPWMPELESESGTFRWYVTTFGTMTYLSIPIWLLFDMPAKKRTQSPKLRRLVTYSC